MFRAKTFLTISSSSLTMPPMFFSEEYMGTSFARTKICVISALFLQLYLVSNDSPANTNIHLLLIIQSHISWTYIRVIVSNINTVDIIKLQTNHHKSSLKLKFIPILQVKAMQTWFRAKTLEFRD